MTSSYKYMDADELVALLDNAATAATTAVVDCRDSDRDDGFIVGSLHAPTLSYTDEMYAGLAQQLAEQNMRVVVFHCALSQLRGPRAAMRFARAQAQLGLSYPLVYVLRGGWSAFYDMYGSTRPDLVYV